MLCLVYDLRVLPASFDFANFVAVAKANSIEIGRENESILPIIILSQSRSGGYFASVEQYYEIKNRIERILVPLCRLFDFLEFPIVVPDTELELVRYLVSKYKIIMPYDYNLDSPVQFKYFKNPMYLEKCRRHDIRFLSNPMEELVRAKGLISEAFGIDDYLCVVERKNSVSHDISRDTSLDYLSSVCFELSKVLPVIFLPDFNSASHISLQDVYTLPSAAYSLLLRSAIYEQALVSVQPPGAGSSLAYLNRKTRYIHNGVASGSYFNEDWCTKNGFKRDFNDYSPDNCNQRWFWELLDATSIRNIIVEIISSSR